MKSPKMILYKSIDTKYDPQTSIVLRYRNAFKSEMADEEDSKQRQQNDGGYLARGADSAGCASRTPCNRRRQDFAPAYSGELNPCKKL